MYENLLLPEEQSLVSKLNINIGSTGITFQRKLTKKEMRVAGRIIVSLKNPINDNDDNINWAVGDWILQADEWFGKDIGMRWMLEEINLRKYRDHLLALSGATLIQMQVLEHFIRACCSPLALKDKKGRALNTRDFLSPNKNSRYEALGTLKNGLKNADIFDISFTTRLDKFVENRNKFVHSFWLDAMSNDSYDSPPSWKKMEGIEQFLHNLLKEAHELENLFQGFFYSIGKELAKKNDWKQILNSDPFIEWSKYEKDFLAIKQKDVLPPTKKN